MTYSNLRELDDMRFNLNNQEDALFYETFRQVSINYFKAKSQYISDAFDNQLSYTTQDFIESAPLYKMEDK
jgi:hypothetical protein